MAFSAVQLDADPGLQLEAGNDLCKIIDFCRLDDGGVDAEAHFDALVETGVEHRAAHAARVGVLEGEEGVGVLRDALAGRAVDVPEQVEESPLGQVEERPQRAVAVQLPTRGEAVRVDVVKLRILRGEDEVFDLVDHFLRNHRRGLPELFIQGLLIEDFHAPSFGEK